MTALALVQKPDNRRNILSDNGLRYSESIEVRAV